MIHQFILPSDNNFYSAYFENEKQLTKLSTLSRVNFFIGANNSGKSRLIRELLKDLQNYRIYQAKDASGLIPLNLNSKQQLSILEIPFQDILISVEPLISTLEKYIRDPAYKMRLKSLLSIPIDTIFDEYKVYIFHADFRDVMQSLVNGDFIKVDLLKEDSKESVRKKYIEYLWQQLSEKIGGFFPLQKGFKCTYVPAYRTLRKLLIDTASDEEKKSLYYSLSPRFNNYGPINEAVIRMRTVFDYFLKKQKSESYSTEESYSTLLEIDNVFTGESLFEDIKDLRNSPEEKRKNLIEYELFLSKNFFNGNTVTLNALKINGLEDVYIKIGNEKEFPIYNLGDGIQAIILLTVPLFFNREYNHFIFYEEPELFLHPGMQRIFLEVLNDFPFVQSFIATHSNHFLDTTIDYPNNISIFSLKKEVNNGDVKFNVEMLSSPKISILNELGVRNSSVLLANCSLWVEGVSDRMYIKRYLDIYQKEHRTEKDKISLLKEDMHFTFLEYGGNNIVHYDFSPTDNDLSKIKASSICNRIFLIHDADIGKEKRHQRLKHQLKNNYYQLDVLEIENLLSPQVLIKTLDSYKLREDNTLFIPNFKIEDYENLPLGKFVNELIPKGLKKIFSSGTNHTTPKLYNKIDFAHKALMHINNWDELTPKAQKLTKAIYKFIKKNNSMV